MPPDAAAALRQTLGPLEAFVLRFFFARFLAGALPFRAGAFLEEAFVFFDDLGARVGGIQCSEVAALH